MHVHVTLGLGNIYNFGQDDFQTTWQQRNNIFIRENNWNSLLVHVRHFNLDLGVSISTDDWRNSSDETHVMNKTYIIKSELKRKLIMMCFQCPLTCYALLVTLEAFLVTQMLYFSQFFPRFFVGLRRICSCAMYLILNRHLFIACKSLLCGYETWMKVIFSWMENTLFCSQFSPRNTGNRI